MARPDPIPTLKRSKHWTASKQEKHMDRFDSIRPYNDDEVASVLQRLLSDEDFLSIITQYRFPVASRYFSWLLRPIIARKLRNELSQINSVSALQKRIES